MSSGEALTTESRIFPQDWAGAALPRSQAHLTSFWGVRGREREARGIHSRLRESYSPPKFFSYPEWRGRDAESFHQCQATEAQWDSSLRQGEPAVRLQVLPPAGWWDAMQSSSSCLVSRLQLSLWEVWILMRADVEAFSLPESETTFCLEGAEDGMLQEWPSPFSQKGVVLSRKRCVQHFVHQSPKTESEGCW